MKQVILCLAVFALSCNHHIISQTPVMVKGNPMLLGKTNENELRKSPFNDWYQKEYAAYHPDAVVMDSLRPMAGEYKYELFFGTWCGDSKREVPRILKMLNELHIQPTMIAVGNRDTLYKQSPQHEERGKNILRVPTLNIYKDGKEAGRIIETPAKSWEKDMLAIIKKDRA